MATGAEILRLAARHLGEDYVLGVIAPKTNKNWKGPWDCAEFASWCVFQVAGKLYGCSTNINPKLADAFTGFWHRDATTRGNIVSLALGAATPGAAFLRIPQANLIGHIAFSDGKGGTIEAHSSRTGVVRKKIAGRRWDMAVLVPGVEYSTNADAVPPTPPLIILRITTPLMRGSLVKQVQRALKAEGFNPGPIDGIYGAGTVAAVNAFQLSNGLLPDGEVGPQTATALGIDLPGA